MAKSDGNGVATCNLLTKKQEIFRNNDTIHFGRLKTQDLEKQSGLPKAVQTGGKQSWNPGGGDPNSNVFPTHFTVSQKEHVIWGLVMSPEESVLGSLAHTLGLCVRGHIPFLPSSWR